MAQPVTLVTGTSKGIGKATAARLAADGHLVIGIARDHAERRAGAGSIRSI